MTSAALEAIRHYAPSVSVCQRYLESLMQVSIVFNRATQEIMEGCVFWYTSRDLADGFE